jgi:UPF0755 protein
VKRWQRALAGLAVGGLVAGAAAVAFLYSQLRPVDPAAEEQAFAIERGVGLAQVAYRLQGQGLIRDARVFVALARYRNLEAALHAGEYLLSPATPADEILEQLVTGRVRSWPVVIPEGLRSHEIAARMEQAGLGDAADFLAAASDPALAQQLGVPADTLEGYLFPDTYRLPKGLSGRELARIMVEQFETVWNEIEPLAAGSPLDRHEIVTLASIVEKETGAAEERPLIAAVFLNRLKRGMRLETDPTVIFGIPDFDGNLRRVHLEDESNPYNTYRIRGLPPGPIASPGREALRAVLQPADSHYLFFVSRGDGTHQFSVSYAEHDRAVDRYQRRRRR